MSTVRRVATAATDLACYTAGRRQVVRAARFVLRRACLDVPNDMRTNGEAFLQRRVLELSLPGRGIRVVDVGANMGRWSSAMMAAARQADRLADLDLHAFEPSRCTFTHLSKTFSGQPATLGQIAFSEHPGISTLHVVAPGAGTNSLHRQPGVSTAATTERVVTTTLDAYADGAGLDYITLVKIDTEGHDLAVLRGARRLLTEQRILIAQFEYNCRWVDARSYLRDAFDLLQPFGYRLGKVTPRGIEFYQRWDPELETFVEGNYIACTSWVAGVLPSVAWWKQAS